MRDDDQSESGSTEISAAVRESSAEAGRAAVGQSPTGAGPTAVRESTAVGDISAGARRMAVGQSPARAGSTAVQETILLDGTLRNFGETGHGQVAVRVEVFPERNHPGQQGRAGEMSAYPSEVGARNLASRDCVGRKRGQGGQRGKHERCRRRGTNELGGGSAAAASGEDTSVKEAEGSAPAGAVPSKAV